jgi:hypothetical protein
MVQIPVSARNKVCDRGSSLSGISVSNPACGMGPGICFECFVLSGRGICDYPVPRNSTERACACVRACMCH